jgi:dihydrofolate reductase
MRGAARLRVQSFAISLDGYGAGPDQDLKNPLGVRGRMAGGTEFRFVTDGIHAALKQATEAAGGRDVRLGGGVSTVREFLQARLIDELHLATRPVLLGSGERLFNGIDAHSLGYDCEKVVAGERATHVFLSRGARS